MAVTSVSICNRALSRIGAQLITSLTSDSKNAQHCNTLYDPTRKELLMAEEWSFAIKRQELTEVATTYTGWDYAYQLPSDCLKVTGLLGASTQVYQIEQDILLTDVEDAEIRYTFDQDDPTEFSALFTEVLALRLAAKLANPIKGSKRLEQELLQEYLLMLGKARGEDAEHAYGEDYSDLWTDR